MREAIRFYLYASAIVGAPILAVIVIVGIQRAFFTLTCETASYRCDKSFGANQAVTSVVSQIVADDDYDVEVKPRKR